MQPENYGIQLIIDASDKEKQLLESALLVSFKYLDKFFGGNFAETFKGLVVHVGDNLTTSAGEAFPEENLVILDRKKNLLTVKEADSVITGMNMAYPGDRINSVPEALLDKPVIVYEVVHEIGHILEGRADLHLPIEQRMLRAEGLADKSPTHLYSQDPTKPHEAFAEAFAHMVFGKDVNPQLKAVVDQAIDDLKAIIS